MATVFIGGYMLLYFILLIVMIFIWLGFKVSLYKKGEINEKDRTIRFIKKYLFKSSDEFINFVFFCLLLTVSFIIFFCGSFLVYSLENTNYWYKLGEIFMDKSMDIVLVGILGLFLSRVIQNIK
ncbi:hypothetical protein ACQV2S_01215 [Facklamia sp. P13064]|uniref:hypothetical protein n=1 Tax=Facklamia sp. P13064 TaxID=3421953 RepID=UPI003D16EBD7